MATRESTARREGIVLTAHSTGVANVEQLALQFGVTPSTIRRDLATLTRDGLLARTYGGAIAIGTAQEQSLRQRAGEAYAQKSGIARWAKQQVRFGDSILLDAGSTVGALAHELRQAEKLTVTSASLSVLDELSDSPGITLQCLGGRLRSLSQSFIGPITEAALERMTFDSVFLGADAVDPIRGICEADLEQTRLKELIARRANKVYVLAHASKIGARPFHAWAHLPGPWTLVTDSGITEEQRQGFAETDVVIVAVDPQGVAELSDKHAPPQSNIRPC